MDAMNMDILTIIERFGVSVAIVIIFSMVAARFLGYLDNRADADEARQKSWDGIRKDDNQQWITTMTSHKVAIEGLGLSFAELLKTIKEDRITWMAYQNTTSSALSGLVVNVQHLMALPAGMNKANDSLTQISKGQRIQLEESSRGELEFKKELAKTNNALVEMQREVKKLATSMDALPDTMKAALSPVFAPLVVMMEQVLSSAQATQAKIDDLPLMNRVVEKDLLEGNGALSTDGKNAVPTNTGDIHIIPTGETVVAE